MFKIRQKALHSNGSTSGSEAYYDSKWTTYWTHAGETGYGQWSEGPKYRWTDSPYSTFNESPSVSGSSFTNTLTVTNNSLTIDRSKITYNDSDKIVSWRIYNSFSTNNSTYGTPTLVTELASGTSTYTLNMADWTAGYYKFYITAYDGNTWSALLKGSSWVADQKETGNGSYNNTKDTITYAVSGAVHLIHYIPNDLGTDYFTARQMNAINAEINRARSANGLSDYNFSTTFIADFTIIHASDINEQRSALNDISTLQGKVGNDIVTGDEIKTQDIKDIINLINSLGD